MERKIKADIENKNIKLKAQINIKNQEMKTKHYKRQVHKFAWIEDSEKYSENMYSMRSAGYYRAS